MKLGVLGAGAMAGALVPAWRRAGHEVMIGGRTRAKAAELAAASGSSHGTLREAAEFGEAVLVAIRWEGVRQTLADAGAADGVLRDKTIIDCTNPVEIENFTLVTPPGRSLAEEIGELTGGNLLKAFNLCEASVWRMDPPRFDDRPLMVPVAGDEAAKQVGARLVADVGAVYLDAGPLRQAVHLEAMAAIVIRLLWNGADLQSVFNWLSPRRSEQSPAGPPVSATDAA